MGGRGGGVEGWAGGGVVAVEGGRGEGGAGGGQKSKQKTKIPRHHLA